MSAKAATGATGVLASLSVTVEKGRLRISSDLPWRWVLIIAIAVAAASGSPVVVEVATKLLGK